MNAPNNIVTAAMKILVVYKHSRYTYAQEQAQHEQHSILTDKNNPLAQSLWRAHEKNQATLDWVINILQKRNLSHRVMCRSKLTAKDVLDCLVICVGGDGTLLDVSHHCQDSPILGVNSDPESSIGALCAAQTDNFEDVLDEIYAQKLMPTLLDRLHVVIDKKALPINPLNDILFCHKNPAAMSRFSVGFKALKEEHRASGMWVATPAGSTGGIFSAGAKPLPLDAKTAIFWLREPSWSQEKKPRLLEGHFLQGEHLVINCHMSDAALFIDGPHKTFDVGLGSSIEISIAKNPLKLFDGQRLIDNREKIIEKRLGLKNHGRTSC